MLNPDKAQSIFDRAKKLTTADDIELIIGGGRSALTRFANSTIHQNVAEEGFVISVRTVIDGKTARATTNKTDDDSLRRAVKSAEELTRVQERDPDLLPMASQQDLPAAPDNAPTRHFAATAA